MDAHGRTIHRSIRRHADQEALAPHRDLAPPQADLDGHVFVLPTLGSQMHHQRPLLMPGLNLPTLGKHTKLPLVVLIQFSRLRNSHCPSLLERMRMPMTLRSINSRAMH